MREAVPPPEVTMTPEHRQSNPWRVAAIILAFACILLGGLLWLSPGTEGNAPFSTPAVQAAAAMSGLDFTESEVDLMRPDLRDRLETFRRLRSVSLPNSLPPALRFNPALFSPPEQALSVPAWHPPVPPPLPQNPVEIAFQPLPVLSAWLRSRRLRSEALTGIYLDRLKELGPKLQCVVNLTEDLALRQARKADRELDSGHWRGPLHGIPYGIKDLFAVPGYPTTWGAAPFKDQVIDEPATVVKRLEEAGAVLVAKLTTGALAWGDVWYGGKTRNPWDLEQGSSGSSAGPAAATAAGLVGFAIGTETWGSIVSPSTRCGVSGLRPTFGRVSRFGAMALSWTMDKVGPICRSAEGTGLVFAAIHGADGKDPDCRDHGFAWPRTQGIQGLRVGIVTRAFASPEKSPADHATLAVLRSLGIEPIEIALPDIPVAPLAMILNAEAAAAFDELTRANRDDELVRQIRNAWPNVFRHARLIPAVEYLQANRVRTLLLKRMAELFRQVDLYICPTFGGGNLLLTNLTGHPALVLPNGFDKDGHPLSITITGDLFSEAELVAMGQALQKVTDHHRKRPPEFTLAGKEEARR